MAAHSEQSPFGGRALDYPFLAVEAVAAIAALPVALAVLLALLRSSWGRRLVAVPSDERWHDRPTPMFGGVGIFAGFAAALLLALATGAVEWSGELGGILAGIALLFAAGLVDDLWHLSPVAKLAAQIGAAVIVLASGRGVEIVGNDVLAWAIGILWLVGITNAFNLLDNMDGLAATLAAIACGYFAIDAVTEHENETVFVLALSLGLACAGFLPFNLRPGRGAHVFMGDSGSQVIGFGLASLALASSWTVAGTTFATVLLPLLILAVPILDTTLVTIVRLAQRRPVTRGGRDHTSHRLVYYGLSEAKAVLLLALVAAAIGATALAYNVLDNARLTAVGVLLTFVLLVQFGSFLSDLEERSRSGAQGPEPSLWRALIFEPRRLVEVVVDFVVVCGSFLAAYLLVAGGTGTEYERSVFLSALPILLACRYVLFVALGIYRRVWRYATARDVVPIAAACGVSAAATYVLLVSLRPIGSFPAVEVLVVDAVLCTLLVGGSRLTLRLVPEARALRGHRRRVLIVGAGRAGRGLARELHDGHEARVVGFLDDNPRVRRRRILGITVVGALDEAPRAIASARAEEVLVTIPDAQQARLDAVVRASQAADVPCRIVHRRTEFSPPEAVEATLS
jgi:UDP-GlcNAc:undecaprenyl-phosphate GlcNAc-1-phosphate transferase